MQGRGGREDSNQALHLLLACLPACPLLLLLLPLLLCIQKAGAGLRPCRVRCAHAASARNAWQDAAGLPALHPFTHLRFLALIRSFCSSESAFLPPFASAASPPPRARPRPCGAGADGTAAAAMRMLPAPLLAPLRGKADEGARGSCC